MLCGERVTRKKKAIGIEFGPWGRYILFVPSDLGYLS